MKRLSPILLLTLGISGMTQAQDCVTIPQNQNWRGTTTQGMADMYGVNDGIIITRKAENTYEISDVSGGFLAEMGTEDASVALAFGCDHQLTSTSVETKYGTLQIVSGNFNASNNGRLALRQS